MKLPMTPMKIVAIACAYILWFGASSRADTVSGFGTVSKDTALYSDSAPPTPAGVARLRPKTLVALLSTNKPARPGQVVVRVVDPRIVLTGWINSADVKSVELGKDDATTRRSNGSASPAGETTPTLISIASPSIREAWTEVRSALIENQKLNRPLPDPYFARAELWSMVNNYDDALRDYLTAFKLSLESGEDLFAYADHFKTLYETLDKLDQVPKPPAFGDSRLHYASGYHAYFAGDLTKALSHFNDAVQLDPKNPVNWYYRALIYKRMGDERRAQHDVLMGAHLEHNRIYKYSLNYHFSRVQGSLREWLERFRLGNPTQSLITTSR